jgi:hypothetical protein
VVLWWHFLPVDHFRLISFIGHNPKLLQQKKSTNQKKKDFHLDSEKMNQPGGE